MREELLLSVEYDDKESVYGEFFTELVVRHKGKVILRETDAGEPEDQTFGRNWSWVSTIIEKAYKLGLKDGKNGA